MSTRLLIIEAPEINVSGQRLLSHAIVSGCGTAALSCAWVEEHRENRAFGIDLDPEPLEWCRQNHFPKLTADQRER